MAEKNKKIQIRVTEETYKEYKKYLLDKDKTIQEDIENYIKKTLKK